MITFKDLVRQEKIKDKLLLIPLIYVDMAGDLIAGIVLSELFYWYREGADNRNKLRVVKEGQLWIAASREEWWERARISPKRVDRALDILAEIGLVEKRIFRFNNAPTTHVRIIEDAFEQKYNEVVEVLSIIPEMGITDTTPDITERVISDITERVKSLTEITTENTFLNNAEKELKECESTKPIQDESIEDWFEAHEKPQEPHPPRTADEVRAMTVEAIKNFNDRTRGKDPQIIYFLGQIPECIRPLAERFCEGIGRNPLKSEKARWIKELKDQYELGLLPEHITQAFAMAYEQGLTYKSPGSLTALAEKAKRERMTPYAHPNMVTPHDSVSAPNMSYSEGYLKLLERTGTKK